MALAQKKDRYADSLREAETLIREGQGSQAASLLERVKARALPREKWASFARLSWRSGVPELGARLLFPVVRGTGHQVADASAEMIAEYAACLAKLGAHREAIDLLRGLSGSQLPRAPLYLAFSLVGVWEYSPSIPLLKQYLKEKDLADYDRYVARLNLAAALVFTKRYWESDGILRRLLHDGSLRRWRRLAGNACEIYGMSLVWRGRRKQAEEILERARRLLGESEAIDQLLVQKGLAAATYLENPKAPKAKRAMRELEAKALALRHWNTLREVDRLRAFATANRSLAFKVAMGTPSDEYRCAVLKENRLAVPSSYRWALGKKGTAKILDLFSARFGERKTCLKPGGVPHRLLVALCSDFYRPIRLATLFHEIFPNEIFHPDHAPTRVHQAVRFLRRSLKRDKIGLEIVFEQEGYRLRAKSALVVEIPLKVDRGSRSSWKIGRLRCAFGQRLFSAAEAAKILSASVRAAQVLLAEAVSRGEVQRVGRRRAARYRFT